MKTFKIDISWHNEALDKTSHGEITVPADNKESAEIALDNIMDEFYDYDIDKIEETEKEIE